MYLLLSATLAQWNFAWMLLHTDRLLNSSTDCKFAWKTTEREKMTGKIINEGFCNYSRTTPQRLPWGRRKLAVVERWPLGGSTALKKTKKKSNMSLTLYSWRSLIFRFILILTFVLQHCLYSRMEHFPFHPSISVGLGKNQVISVRLQIIFRIQ